MIITQKIHRQCKRLSIESAFNRKLLLIYPHILPIHNSIKLIRKQNWSTALFGSGDKGQLTLNLTLSNHNRSHLFDNTRLFTGNFFQCITEELSMIPADVGNYASQRTNHIGRIESATHAHLYDRNIDLLSRKIVESYRCSNFKKGGLNPIYRLTILLDKIDHLLFGDHLTVDFDSFPKIFQMRRCKEAGPITGRLQHGSQHMRHRTFAIGSCNMHAPETAMRFAEFLFESYDIVESGFIGTPTNMLKNRE